MLKTFGRIVASIAPFGAFLLLWSPAVALQSRVTNATPEDSGRVSQVEAIVVAASAVWTAEFARLGMPAYSTPGLMFLRMPPGHPGRGTGYFPGVGLSIDLDETEILQGAPTRDGALMIVLLVTHELGHHIQRLQAAKDGPDVTGLSGPERERQADCYAGWTIARLKARDDLRLLAPSDDVSTIDRTFEAELDLLSPAANYSRALEIEARTHGERRQRVAALRQGLLSTSSTECQAP